MKELHYNVTGQDRKELVGIISKVVGMKAGADEGRLQVHAHLRLRYRRHHR